MSKWKEYKLRELGEIVTGKTPSQNNPEDWGVEMLFVTPSDYKNYRKFSFDSDRKISKTGIERQKNKVLPQNSVLVTCIGSDMGKIVINKVPCITNQQINSIIPDDNIVDFNFLYYQLVSSYETLKSYGSDGTAVPILNKGDFSELSFLFPPLSEQCTIASILSSLDDKIDLLHRQNKTLEAMAETLFRQWFVEEAEDSCLGKISDLIEFNPKRSLSKGAIAPYLEMSNLSNELYYPTNWYDREFSSGTKFINGDTLLARITPCLENGKTAFVDFLEENQVGWGSTEYIVMRSKMNLHPYFSYIIARYEDFRNYAIGCMVGSSGRQRVDVDNIMNYEIQIPSEETIEKFNKSINTILLKMNNNNIQSRALAKLRDELLPKLMSGEIKIKNNL